MTSDPLGDFDAEIVRFLESRGVQPDTVQLSTPPEREFGERSTNVAFRLAKERRQAPKQIAEEIAGSFEADTYRFISGVQPAGAGFINFYLNYSAFIPHVVEGVARSGPHFGRRPDAPCRELVVEHTSVNPNKEWHVGHLRNAVLGDVVARTLSLAGNHVQVQNYIDDTGAQAATSVVGLVDFPEEPVPGEKFDHYAGRSYVKLSAELASEGRLKARLEELERDPSAAAAGPVDEITAVRTRLDNIERLKARVFQVMHLLEQGEYQELVRRILDGQLLTAYRLGIFYHLLTWESHLVESHVFQQAMDLIGRSPRVYRATEGYYAGAFVIQMGEPKGEEEAKHVVLIRKNGLPTYEGKDIAYHMWKFHLVPNRLGYVPFATQPNGEVLWATDPHGAHREEQRPEGLINIIAVDQTLAQSTVKEALRVAGFPTEADELFHLAYGLVMSPEGKLAGRKGNAMSADDVIYQAVHVAHDRVREKRSQDLSEDQMAAIAEAVGIGAVRYFMVQYNPMREIVFNVGDVVSYDGNTGLYVQYALVRMFAILRRARDDRGILDDEIKAADLSLLGHEQEKRLIYHIGLYPGVIADAARTLSVNLVAEFAYECATIFSQFYRDCTVLDADPALRAARLKLVQTVRDVLSSACGILGVPVIERL